MNGAVTSVWEMTSGRGQRSVHQMALSEDCVYDSRGNGKLGTKDGMDSGYLERQYESTGYDDDDDDDDDGLALTKITWTPKDT